MNEPIQVGEHSMQVGASVGVAVFPDDAGDIEALCIAADLRMYDDKNVSREGTGERIPVRSEPLPEHQSQGEENIKIRARASKL